MTHITLPSATRHFWIAATVVTGSLLLSVSSTCSAPSKTSSPILSLRTTTTWQTFDIPASISNRETCALHTIITCNAKRPFSIQSLVLRWSGKPLRTIDASLYVKPRSGQLQLTKNNVIGDGTWSKNGRYLAFCLDEKLIATKQYFLVLSFPSHLESIVKAGSFRPSNTTKRYITPLS